MKISRISLGLAVAALVSANAAHGSVIEEIVVTATKKEESIQDIAISVSALSGEQIDTLNLSDLTDISQQFPAMQVTTWSPQLTIFNLRGVSQNNFVDNLEAPIAVYQDDAYIASLNAVSGQLYDLDRVEVLRGPQGTLFGRNATGGLIHYVSKGAEDDEFNGYLEANGAEFNRRSIEGAIGGGLSDRVRARLAFRWEEADGYIEADTGIPPVDPREMGGADGYSVRATFQADFSDSLQGDFIIKHSKDDDVPTGGYVFENCEFDANELCPVDEHGRAITLPGVVSGDEHVHQNDTRGFLDRDTLSLTARFTKALGNGNEFVSITNYLNVEKEYLEDGDAFPAPIVVFGQNGDIDQVTQEFRLSGATDRMEWQVGFYYMDYEFDGPSLTQGAPNIDLSFQLFGAGFIPAPTVADDNPFDGRVDTQRNLTVENYSVFGQVDYALSDTLMLTAGLRFSSDTKEMDWGSSFTSDQQTTPLPYAATSSNENFGQPTILNAFTDDVIDYDDWAARLSLQKQFSDATLGFVSWNRGIKGGNWTLASAVSPDRFQHDEEVLNAWEAGIKTDLSDRMRINATAFYYDYKDYQNFVAIPPEAISPNPQVGNSDASSYGGEVEIFWNPIDQLDVILGFALNDSEVDQVEAGDSPIRDAELPGAPRHAFNYLLRYTWPAGNGEIALQFDGAWHDDQFLEVTNGPGTLQESYNVSNVSLTYANERFMVSVWSKNLFDEIYKAYSLDLGVLGATTYYAPPQTVGATARINF